MTNINIQKAREWAKKYQRHHVIGAEGELAAVRVIQSLPDRWIGMDEVREAINDQLSSHPHGTVGNLVMEDIACKLQALLDPPPQSRTLADMSLEELQGYIGGEVMVDGWANPTMLVSVIEDEGAVLARRLNNPWPFVEVRPLSDLTPVAAPGQEAESTPDDVAYATGGTLTTQDVVDECRAVRKERSLPRPEDVPPGEWWSVQYYGREWAGVRSDHVMEPWSVISMDGLDYRDVDDLEISLMFRLVPEVS